MNSVATAGLNASLDWLKQTPVYEHEKKLTEYLIDQLNTLDNVQLYLPENKSSILGIVSIAINGYSSSDAGTILSEDFSINVRTGYHCAPYVHEFIGSLDTSGTVRISIGYFTCIGDIDRLISGIADM